MKYRGITEKGEVVKGFYVYLEGYAYIIIKEALMEWQEDAYRINGVEEIIPASLAMFTTQYDKNNQEIYGSIPLEDGEMSRGGDIVKLDTPENADFPTRNRKIIYNQKFAQFCVEPCTALIGWPSVEVIGTQWKEQSCKSKK